MPGSAWQKVRERILRANPLCVMCQSEGKLAPAVEVDHKVPIHLGGSDDDVNLQGLCAPHHRSKLINELSTLYGKAR
jgi:5-methylcytosine-specific restriction protein A